MIYAFGDSNVRIFETMPNTKVFSFSGASCYQIGKMGITINDVLESGSKSIFMFGAVDTRKHIAFMARKSGESWNSVMDRVVCEYTESIKAFCDANHVKGFVSAVIPEAYIPDHENIEEHRAIGVIEERVIRYKSANLRLMECCANVGLSWFDPFGFFKLHDGRLDPAKENTENICHIADEWHYIVHEEFRMSSR